MKLYFSIISQEGQPQTQSKLSLGGFCSSSLVSSGALNSIFSDVSTYTIEKRRKEYVCLILKNDTGQVAKDIEIWINQNANDQCKFRIGLASSNIKGEFEAVPNPFSKPMYTEFNSADGQNDSIAIPDMQDEDKIGIWIERSINEESDEISKRNDCDWLYANKDVKKATVETIELKISWLH